MGKAQLHKRMTTDQVVAIIKKFLIREVSGTQASKYLEVGRTRFYQLVHEYNRDKKSFVVDYDRHEANHRIDKNTEDLILKELKIEKEKIIDNPLVPTKRYNYSYLVEQLSRKHDVTVSLSTVIDRAKTGGYWKPKLPKKIHDREVLTNYVGELIQHDSSLHLFAPDGKEKWYLTTSLDDHSRKLLFADFFLHETTWTNIYGLQSVFLQYGFPLSYYADQHPIYRYVKDRDKQRPGNIQYTKFTDDVITQWKRVLLDCQVKPIYALSPEAKGKIERPYGWLQDHIVRTCVRDNVTKISEGREILKAEVRQYNSVRVHSTTMDIPDRRFAQAIQNEQSLFRPWKLPEPWTSVKDVFCLVDKRTVDSYRKISLHSVTLTVPKVPPKYEVELRMYPNFKDSLVEIRFWFKNHFVGEQKVKMSDLPTVRF